MLPGTFRALIPWRFDGCGASTASGLQGSNGVNLAGWRSAGDGSVLLGNAVVLLHVSHREGCWAVWSVRCTRWGPNYVPLHSWNRGSYMLRLIAIGPYLTCFV